MDRQMNFIIAGGGTGGHFYPAIAIGTQLMERSNANIHYVGSTFGIEAEKLPAMGLNHTLLPIRGLQRSLSIQSLARNVLLPGRLIKSKMRTNQLFNDFRPDAVVGTGGYASALPLHTAAKREMPYFIQEQNSLPGITTRHFAPQAKVVFTAFKEVENHIKKKTAFCPEIRFGRILQMEIA